MIQDWIHSGVIYTLIKWPNSPSETLVNNQNRRCVKTHKSNTKFRSPPKPDITQGEVEKTEKKNWETFIDVSSALLPRNVLLQAVELKFR
jgi:hypothetical protein